MIGSKVPAILLEGDICLLVLMHLEGSAPAACAVGLFYKSFTHGNPLHPSGKAQCNEFGSGRQMKFGEDF